MDLNERILEEEKAGIKQHLYSKFKKNNKISEAISERNKKAETIENQIKLLQATLDEVSYELSILQEIKSSQKTFLAIDKHINDYIQSIESQGLLNTWKTSLDISKDGVSTKMESIKNAAYTANIITNINTNSKFYRIDFELSLSSLLLGLAKEHKQKFLKTNSVVIQKNGVVVFSEKDVDNFTEKTKNDLSVFFQKSRASILKEFCDIENNKFTATDFIEYDGMLLDDFEVIELTIENKEEVPF